LARASSRVKAIVKKAENHVKAKDFAAAGLIVRDGLAEFPGNSKLLHLAGRTAYHMGDYSEAVTLLQSALAVSPEANAFFDLGLVHRARGNLADAISCFRAAVQRDPRLHRAHVNLGFVLRRQGDLISALEAYYTAFKLDTKSIVSLHGVSGILGQVTTEHYEPLVDEMLVCVFEAAGADFQVLAPAAAHQLINKYGVKFDGSSILNLDPKDPLLRHYLTKCINIDPALEQILTRCRRDLLFTPPQNLDENASGMAVLIALQSFNNEYVFYSDTDENAAVSAKHNQIESALASGKFSKSFGAEILVLSMFRPLSAVAGAQDQVNVLAANDAKNFREVVRVTLQNHMEEQALKSTIDTFSEIDDQTSRDVRAQYEEHPYPRWINIPHVMRTNLPALLKNKFPHFSQVGCIDDPATILIAGCGTGRHVAIVAMQWPRADILAIDISTASIAYSMRKIKELGIKNVRFLHGDILEAGKLGGPFDMVQSIGVLHHMKEPLEGWRILSRLIRSNGVFRGGLYSERGRQFVFEVRRAIAKEGIGSRHADITGFRRCILRGEVLSDIPKIIEFADFFSTSNCRDLMFHAHEDSYTPLKLKAEIEDAGLFFLGFNELEERGVNAEYRKRFPRDPSMTDLSNWEELEKNQKYPPEGYDFWCWKP